MPEKTRLATMFTCASPPRNRPTAGLRQCQQPLEHTAGVHQVGDEDEQRHGEQQIVVVEPVHRLVDDEADILVGRHQIGEAGGEHGEPHRRADAAPATNTRPRTSSPDVVTRPACLSLRVLRSQSVPPVRADEAHQTEGQAQQHREHEQAEAGVDEIEPPQQHRRALAPEEADVVDRAGQRGGEDAADQQDPQEPRNALVAARRGDTAGRS